MENKLRKRLIAVLEEGIKGEVILGYPQNDINSEDQHYESAYLLKGQSFLMQEPGFGLKTSLSGLEYLERLKHPQYAWIRDNWFPAIVAAATIVLAGVSAGVQLVSLLTSNSGS